MAGTQYCRITPQGDVTPCPTWPSSPQRPRTELQRGLATSSVLQELRDLKQLKGGAAAASSTISVEAALPAMPPMATICKRTGLSLPADRATAEVEKILWSAEARATRTHPDPFIRGKVKQGLEAYAQRRDRSNHARGHEGSVGWRGRPTVWLVPLSLIGREHAFYIPKKSLAWSSTWHRPAPTRVLRELLDPALPSDERTRGCSGAARRVGGPRNARSILPCPHPSPAPRR